MLEIRPASTGEDLAHVARIVSMMSPDNPTSVGDMARADRQFPGGQREISFIGPLAAARTPVVEANA